MNEFLDIHALADGELDAEQASILKQRIQSDLTLRREHESILNLKDLVKEKSLRYESEECWRACVGRLNELDRAGKVKSFVSRYAWAFCGALFVSIIGARFLVKDIRGDTVRAADLGQIFPLGNSHPSPASPAQESEFRALLSRARDVLNPGRLQITCAPARAQMGDIPITRFDLREGNVGLELYVISAQVNFEDVQPLASDPSVSAGVIPSYGDSVNCLIWNDDGRTLVLAGRNQSESELEQARAEIQAH